MKQTYCNSREEILGLAASDDLYAEALKRAKETDAFWRSSFQDDESRLCGWFHNFVCPKCASTFKQDYAYRPGRAFVCEHCGAEASGKDLDEAWVFGYRYDASQALTSSALMYRVYGDRESLDYIVRFVDFYADAYERFPVHGLHAGQGKITGQSLDEAVWAAAVIRALSVCGKDSIPSEKLAVWREKLFLPLAGLIGRQVSIIHNIHLWLQSARGLIALFFEDEALLRDALESGFGIRNQAKKGYTADGLWHELSLGYHYYATEALCEFVAAYALIHPDDELVGILRRAYQTPGLLSRDGWTLPSINDMGYPAKIASRSRPAVRAFRVAPSPELAFQIRQGLAGDRARLIGADTLLFMPCGEETEATGFTPPRKHLFPSSCLAVMNSPMYALMKTGSLVRSHMHADALSVILSPFSDDLGTSGYGHPMYGSYYRTSLCHNTVLMDGVSQPSRPQEQTVSDVPGGFAGRVENLFDGVSGVRTLTERGRALKDVMELTSDAVHQFDWVFHAAGEAELPSGGKPSAVQGGEASYGYLTDVMEYPAENGLTARFTLNGKRLTVRLSPETTRDARVFAAHMPGNPADISLTAVIVRREGAHVRFEAQYEEDMP